MLYSILLLLLGIIQPLTALGFTLRALLALRKHFPGLETAKSNAPYNLTLGLLGTPLFFMNLPWGPAFYPQAHVLGLLSLTLAPLLPTLTPLGKIRWITPLCSALAILPMPLLVLIFRHLTYGPQFIRMIDVTR